MTTTSRRLSTKVAAIGQMHREVLSGERCARCQRPAPSVESNEYVKWEAHGPDGTRMVCPDCVTPAERQAMDEADMALDAKVRENKLRRMAERQGLRLVKSRRRDPRAIGYGGFMIVDQNNVVVAGEVDSARALDLDTVEHYLTSGPDGT